MVKVASVDHILLLVASCSICSIVGESELLLNSKSCSAVPILTSNFCSLQLSILHVLSSSLLSYQSYLELNSHLIPLKPVLRTDLIVIKFLIISLIFVKYMLSSLARTQHVIITQFTNTIHQCLDLVSWGVGYTQKSPIHLTNQIELYLIIQHV